MEAQLIETLIERISHRDEQAFRTLYDMYKSKVFNTAKVITGDEKAAEDILQEVFVTIYTKVYKLNHPEAFETWLYKIITNKCNNLYRNNRRTLISDDRDIENAAGEDSGESPSQLLTKKETNEELMDCVNGLPEKFRLCIILYYFNELTIRQIGEVIDCSEGTVKSRLFKAKKLLAKGMNIKLDSEVKNYVYR